MPIPGSPRIVKIRERPELRTSFAAATSSLSSSSRPINGGCCCRFTSLRREWCRKASTGVKDTQRPGLALHRERGKLLQADSLDEVRRFLTNDDLPGAGVLLKARGDVHDVAGHQVLVHAWVANHILAES